MKTIINYFKKRQDERLRAKIALKTGHNVNDLQTVYEFIKGAPVSDKFGATIDGGLILTESLTGHGEFSDKVSLKGAFQDKVGKSGSAIVDGGKTAFTGSIDGGLILSEPVTLKKGNEMEL